MNSRSTVVAIALGSNLGDRNAHLDFACSRLSTLLTGARFSSRYDTEAVGTPDAQARYLNAAVLAETVLEPLRLLHDLHAIEAARGRERPYANAPRTLDVDLILYGDLVLDSSELVLPHPRFRERRFVLEPLAEIAPHLIDPVTGRTIAELLRALPT